MRRSDSIVERLELQASVVLCFQEAKRSQYVVRERLTIRLLWNWMLPQPGCPQPLIQLLYARDKLTLLPFQHVGITLGKVPAIEFMGMPTDMSIQTFHCCGDHESGYSLCTAEHVVSLAS